MAWWEDRICNGLAKAGGGSLTQRDIERLLAHDITSMPTIIAPQQMICGQEFGRWRQHFLASSQEQSIYTPASRNRSRLLAHSALAVFSQITPHPVGST